MSTPTPAQTHSAAQELGSGNQLTPEQKEALVAGLTGAYGMPPECIPYILQWFFPETGFVSILTGKGGKGGKILKITWVHEHEHEGKIILLKISSANHGDTTHLYEATRAPPDQKAAAVKEAQALRAFGLSHTVLVTPDGEWFFHPSLYKVLRATEKDEDSTDGGVDAPKGSADDVFTGVISNAEASVKENGAFSAISVITVNGKRYIVIKSKTGSSPLIPLGSSESKTGEIVGSMAEGPCKKIVATVVIEICKNLSAFWTGILAAATATEAPIFSFKLEVGTTPFGHMSQCAPVTVLESSKEAKKLGLRTVSAFPLPGAAGLDLSSPVDRDILLQMAKKAYRNSSDHDPFCEGFVIKVITTDGKTVLLKSKEQYYTLIRAIREYFCKMSPSNTAKKAEGLFSPDGPILRKTFTKIANPLVFFEWLDGFFQWLVLNGISCSDFTFVGDEPVGIGQLVYLYTVHTGAKPPVLESTETEEECSGIFAVLAAGFPSDLKASLQDSIPKLALTGGKMKSLTHELLERAEGGELEAVWKELTTDLVPESVTPSGPQVPAMKHLVLVIGPVASGKTSFGAELFEVAGKAGFLPVLHERDAFSQGKTGTKEASGDRKYIASSGKYNFAIISVGTIPVFDVKYFRELGWSVTVVFPEQAIAEEDVVVPFLAACSERAIARSEAGEEMPREYYSEYWGSSREKTTVHSLQGKTSLEIAEIVKGWTDAVYRMPALQEFLSQGGYHKALPFNWDTRKETIQEVIRSCKAGLMVKPVYTGVFFTAEQNARIQQMVKKVTGAKKLSAAPLHVTFAFNDKPGFPKSVGEIGQKVSVCLTQILVFPCGSVGIGCELAKAAGSTLSVFPATPHITVKMCGAKGVKAPPPKMMGEWMSDETKAETARVLPLDGLEFECVLGARY